MSGFCRDCADNNGTCPNSGLPCDPKEHDELTLKLKAQLDDIGKIVAKTGAGYDDHCHCSLCKIKAILEKTNAA